MSIYVCLSRAFHGNALRFLRTRRPLPRPIRYLLCVGMLAATAAQAAPLVYLADRELNALTVVDIAGYNTIATSPLGAERAPATQVVVNAVTGKVFIAERSGVLIVDAATNTITGEIPIVAANPSPPASVAGVRALAVSHDGSRLYALTASAVTVIDPAKRSILASIAVDPSSLGIAVDADGETVFVAHLGQGPDGSALGEAGVTVIDALTRTVERVIPTPGFRPYRIAINLANDRIYVAGRTDDGNTSFAHNRAYLVFDPVTFSPTRVTVVTPDKYPNLTGFGSLVFNADGSRLYLGTQYYAFNGGPIPLVEVDAATGVVTRVLEMPSSFGDQNATLHLAASFANNKFVLAAFMSEHLHHFPSEPPRRIVFMDGLSGNVLKNLVFTSPSQSSTGTLVGDFLDRTVTPVPTPTKTTTALESSPKPPLRRTVPVSFHATVTGNNPTGKLVFKFVSHERGYKLVKKIPMILSSGKATLALPACTDRWQDHALRKIVCRTEFSVIAKYRGDAANIASKSDVLVEN